MSSLHVSLFFASITCAACAKHTSPVAVAKDRAEFDLLCPRGQLVVTRAREGSPEYFIDGCGRRALYVCSAFRGSGVSCRVAATSASSD
jgi:hypothetical protein